MYKRAMACAAVAALLGGCGGGHSSVLPVPAATSKPVSSEKATMIVKIPTHTAASAGRKPAYISPSTKSIGFSYYPAGGSSQPQPQSADVTPGSPGCTADANGNTVCTLTFGAVAGSIDYTVTAYDAKGGTGNVLGAANAAMTVTAGQDNQFSVTLDGVAASFKVGFAQTSIPAGTPAAVPITISAYDTDGNLIVNSPKLADASGNSYTATVSTVDSTEFQITQNGNALYAYQGSSTTSIVNQPYTGLAVNYNGGLRKNESVTFTQGNVSANAALNVSAPTSTAQLVYAGWYYYGSFRGGEDSSGVLAFPGGGNGPINGVAGMSWTGNMTGTCTSGSWESYDELTTDANGDVAFRASSPCSGTPASYPAIVAQAPAGSAPAFAITQLPDYVDSFGFDSTNAPYIWFDLGNQTVGGVTADHAEIVALRPGSNGAYDGPSMVARTIDYVNNPETLLVAPDGTVYAAHVGDAGNHVNTEAIDVFAPGANGSATSTAAPERYIGGAMTNLASIKQLALDSKGNLYVANRGNGSNSSITVYAAGASGDVVPVRQIQGSNTGLSPTSGGYIQGVGLDAFDNIYALVGGQILVFAAGSDGNVAPIRTMSYGGACCSDTIAVVK
ncbi:MAG TPA: hypothetical protein VFN37_02225 [Candidatus Baltobacteraceae bacterium]|nr:hypothetical protein [Candidatus Baltobacteraceae bacterium]